MPLQEVQECSEFIREFIFGCEDPVSRHSIVDVSRRTYFHLVFIGIPYDQMPNRAVRGECDPAAAPVGERLKVFQFRAAQALVIPRNGPVSELVNVLAHFLPTIRGW